MTQRFTLITCLFFVFTIQLKAQTSEGEVFEITSRVKIYLPETDNAVLEGSERYIRIGLFGNQTDKNNLIGYMDRFIIDGNDMTSGVVQSSTDQMIDYYKFYLNPLYDANNFQKMLEMLKVDKYYIGTAEKPVNTFSNTILAYIKSKKI